MDAISTRKDELRKETGAEEIVKKVVFQDTHKSPGNLSPLGVFANQSKVLQPSSVNNHSRARQTSGSSNPYGAFANRIQLLRGPVSKPSAKSDEARARASRTPEPQQRGQTPGPDDSTTDVTIGGVDTSKPTDKSAVTSTEDEDSTINHCKIPPVLPFSPTRPPSPALEKENSTTEETTVHEDDSDPKMDVDQEKSSVIEVSDESRQSTPQKRKRTQEPETRPSSPVPVVSSSIIPFASLPEAQIASSNPYPEDDFDLDPTSSEPATQTQTQSQEQHFGGDDSKSFSGHERAVKRRKYYDAMDTVLMKALNDKKRASLKIGQMERLAKKKDEELRELQERVNALEKEQHQTSVELKEKNEECARLKEDIQQVISQKDEAKGLFSKFANEFQRAFGN